MSKEISREQFRDQFIFALDVLEYEFDIANRMKKYAESFEDQKAYYRWDLVTHILRNMDEIITAGATEIRNEDITTEQFNDYIKKKNTELFFQEPKIVEESEE